MTAAYDGAAARWATGATIVYGPIATELVRRSPHPLAGRVVLDVGAGTGAGSAALRSVGARPVALDLSHDMVRWDRDHRPPAVVASVDQVPFGVGTVDDVYASFVLNHVAHPVAAMRELASTAHPGGAFLATVFADEPASPTRDRIDAVARAWGWEPPDWYTTMKREIVPLLGNTAAMRDGATEAGLRSIAVEASPVDVGVTRAEQLVDHRFGQAHVSPWLAGMDGDRSAAVRRAAIAEVEPVMAPYRPVVIFLVATISR